jgi:hypothetical protein
MSIYAKPISQLTTADLHELLNERAVENIRLEFKREVPGKDETLKKLSSFANTYGGLVVVGASAPSKEGRIESLPGVDEQNGYKQKIVDWSFAGITPPLTVEVSDPIPTPDGNGKVCYVISVVESDLAPHFVNGREGIWIRTDEFSGRFRMQLANESELRQLFDRRKTVLQRRADLIARARKRFSTHVASTQNFGDKPKTILEFNIVPRFPALPVCEQRKLRPLIMNNQLGWRGVGFPILNNNIISQHESVIVLKAMGDPSIVEANVWGLLFYGVQIEDDHYAGGQQNIRGIHLNQFIGSILVFIYHAQEMIQGLGYSGPLLVETALTSLRNVQWLFSPGGNPWIETKAGSVLDDDVTFSIDTSSDELRERPDGVVMNILRYIFFSVDWPGLTEPLKLEQMVRNGYTYNSWGQPKDLRT